MSLFPFSTLFILVNYDIHNNISKKEFDAPFIIMRSFKKFHSPFSITNCRQGINKLFYSNSPMLDYFYPFKKHIMLLHWYCIGSEESFWFKMSKTLK
jgi:hypothetical protein